MNTNPRPASRGVAATAAVVLALSGVAASCSSDSEDASETTAATDSGTTTGGVTVSDPWARPGDAGGNSAIYMELTGGDEDDALVAAAVPTDVAAVTEVHETVAADEDTGSSDMGDSDMGDSDMGDSDSGDAGTDGMDGDGMESSGDMDGMDGDGMDMGDGSDHGGMMTMREVDSIEVPAGETVALEPGGYHVMLIDLQRDLEPGDTVEATLTFESGAEETVTAEVREP